MEDEEDLCILPDECFENVVNESINQSTDALVDDSFSEVVESMQSTPITKGKQRKGKQKEMSPEPSSRVLRSHSPSLSSPSRPTSPASPSPSTASPRRSLRLSQAQSPLRNSHSPARPSTPVATTVSSPRRSQRIAAQPASPQPSTSSAQPTRTAQPSRVPSTRNTQTEPKRIKCRECPATLKNERTFAIHKKLHALKRALARVSSSEDFLENVPLLLQETMNLLSKEPSVGTYANDLKILLESFVKSLENIGEFHDELFKFLHSHLYPLVQDCQGVFSSSLSYVFHVGVNKLLNNQEFVTQLKMHIVGLEEFNMPSDSAMNIFIGSLMLNLTTATITFITKKIHGASSNDPIYRKRSADKIDSQTFLQLCYHIGGAVVNGFLYKGERYMQTNPLWASFVNALQNKFMASEAVGNQCADEVSEFTKEKDRGKLKHISQEALDFFVVLFDLLMSLEGDDGSIPTELLHTKVLEDNVILCLWDILVGCEVNEDASLDFLMQVTESCRLVVVKGIIYRRLNNQLKKSYAAVSLRSRLSE